MRFRIGMIVALTGLAGLSLLQQVQGETISQAVMPVTAVPQVDLQRYQGTWYEIARLPMFFQRNCDRNVSATYTLQANGKVKVDNRCQRANGRMMQSVGEAYAINPPANSQLKVTFLPRAIRWLPLPNGNYWVLKIDPDYQTVLVGEPGRRYLWLLSRQPQESDAVFTEYMNAARQMGYNLQPLIRTRQTGNMASARATAATAAPPTTVMRDAAN